MIDEARRKRCTDIFKLEGNVYAFDSTTIDLCLSVFEWARFRTTNGGVKVHTMYDVETRVPAFVHITPAAVHDMNAMDVIPYEPGSFYIFDRGYNDFKRLYRINVLKSFFVIRSKGNLKYKIVKWKRRLPKNVLSDAEIEPTWYYPSKYYPERLRLIRYWDEEQGREFMSYCLVAVVQHDMRLERSTYEVLQILSISLTDKTPLRDLFDKTDYHDVKEQIDNSELLLF